MNQVIIDAVKNGLMWIGLSALAVNVTFENGRGYAIISP